jgi:hypothetical protein
LECLCRPRFFAGQILTEADLNRLEQYVVNKNKLYNRYLHGWGVVCGMEVLTHPCGDRVTVRSGYALSPCGDDIILCKDDVALICDLIRRCRPVATTYPDCTTPSTGTDPDCQEVTEDWILAVCYDETAARGITPMLAASTGCGCGCGGSSAAGCRCGCGCGGSKASSNGSSSVSKSGCRTTTRTPPAPCEPTLTCEGYSFIVYKAPITSVPVAPGTQVVGRIAGQFSTIFQNLTVSMPPPPQSANPPGGAQAWRQWAGAFKQWLYDQLSTQPGHDRTLIDLLAAVRVPEATGVDSPSYIRSLYPVLSTQIEILGEVIRQNLCSLLFPPCPAPVACNCVPLATITVRRRDCTVLRVCNGSPRKLVLTFPHLIDWLEGTSLFESLAKWIETLCCSSLRPLIPAQFTLAGVSVAQSLATQAAGPPPTIPGTPNPTTPTSTTPAPTPTGTIGDVGATASPFAQLLSRSWLTRDEGINPTTLALAAIGATDANNSPLVAPLEMTNPAAFLTINQVVRPTLEAILPPELSQLLATLAMRSGGTSSTTPTAATASAAGADDLATLRRELDELKATVKAQADEIAKLKKR